MKNLLRFTVIMVVPLTILFMSMNGCEGPRGRDGGNGTSGQDGNNGTNASACLRPCHNQPEGIWAQYRESTHFEEIFLTEEQDAFTAGTCGKCHAKDGLVARLDGLPNSPANTDLGHFSYLNGSTVTESAYDGETTTAQITCVTCHAVLPDTSAFNQHNPAAGYYTAGNFPRRIQTAQGMYIEKSSGPALGTGTQIDNFHDGNTCAMCHKSRNDLADKTKLTPTGGDTISLGTNRRFGPHEGPTTDLYSGKGGYQFGSNTYTNSLHLTGSAFTGTTGQGCVACHMGDRTENYGYPNHNFKPIVTATCSPCHPGAVDIDDIGTASKTIVQNALAQLRGILDTYVPVMSTGGTAAAGLLSQTDNSESVIDSIYCQPDPRITSAQVTAKQYWHDAVRVQRIPTFNPVTGSWTFKLITIKLTKDQAGAVWNYFLVARSKGYAAHNYKYSLQLLYDSIVAFAGTPSFSRPT